MITFTTNIKWLNFVVELGVFALIVSLLDAITPAAFVPAVFFLLGVLTVYWDNNHTTIYKDE